MSLNLQRDKSIFVEKILSFQSFHERLRGTRRDVNQNQASIYIQAFLDMNRVK